MEAQKQVNGIGVGAPHSSLQALVSGPQISPLPTEENTWDRNAVWPSPTQSFPSSG